MKKLIIIIGLVISFTFIGTSAFAQTGPEPPAKHDQTGNQNTGGGAPIDGGIVFLLAMGAAYGGKKLYHRKSEPLEE